jgi:hypothetical protein
MMRTCERAGIYDPDKIRGRGVWVDEGRVVMHLGDRLRVGGIDRGQPQIKSYFVYEQARAMDVPVAVALNDQEAKRLIALCCEVGWENRDRDGRLLAGALVASMLCGGMPPPHSIDRTDYGPSIRLNRGEIEKQVATCPDNPNATIKWGEGVAYEVLWRPHAVDDAQCEACGRYLMDAEAALGARNRPIIQVTRAGPWDQSHPSERQVKALVSLRNARAILGGNGPAHCDLLIVENLSVRKIAERRNERQEVSMRQVLATRTRLGEHWGM